MKVPKFNVGDVIWIKWEDHYHNYSAGWSTEEERLQAGGYDPMYIESVGIVIHDNGKNVAFSCTRAEDGMSNGGFGVKIKSCIVDFKILKKAKKSK